MDFSTSNSLILRITLRQVLVQRVGLTTFCESPTEVGRIPLGLPSDLTPTRLRPISKINTVGASLSLQTSVIGMIFAVI